MGGCLFATTAPRVFASPTHPIAALAGLLRPIIAPALSNSLSRNACALLQDISLVVVVAFAWDPYSTVRRIRLECSDCGGGGGGGGRGVGFGGGDGVVNALDVFIRNGR